MVLQNQTIFPWSLWWETRKERLHLSHLGLNRCESLEWAGQRLQSGRPIPRPPKAHSFPLPALVMSHLVTSSGPAQLVRKSRHVVNHAKWGHVPTVLTQMLAHLPCLGTCVQQKQCPEFRTISHKHQDCLRRNYFETHFYKSISTIQIIKMERAATCLKRVGYTQKGVWN